MARVVLNLWQPAIVPALQVPSSVSTGIGGTDRKRRGGRRRTAAVHYLVATDSVHATAAACDYLEPRVSTADEVTVAALAGTDERDAGDAANVATARLVGRTELDMLTLAEADPIEALLDVVTDSAVDVLLVASSVGDRSRTDGVNVATALVGRTPVPLVVVPESREA